MQKFRDDARTSSAVPLSWQVIAAPGSGDAGRGSRGGVSPGYCCPGAAGRERASARDDPSGADGTLPGIPGQPAAEGGGVRGVPAVVRCLPCPVPSRVEATRSPSIAHLRGRVQVLGRAVR